MYNQRRLLALQEQFHFARVIHNHPIHKMIVAKQYIIMCINFVYTYVYVQRVSVVHALSVCSFVIALSVRLSQSNMLHCILYLLTFAACVFTCFGLCMLWFLIAAHNTPFCLSNGRLSRRLLCACGIPFHGVRATSSPRALLKIRPSSLQDIYWFYVNAASMQVLFLYCELEVVRKVKAGYIVKQWSTLNWLAWCGMRLKLGRKTIEWIWKNEFASDNSSCIDKCL